jgi:TldD protein
MTTRRRFLRATAAASVATLLPLRGARAGSWSALNPAIDPESGPDDPILRDLALRALDAARSAGASYADVRFTADRTQKVSLAGSDATTEATETGEVFIGVRALADGFWGFASGTVGTPDAVTRLATEAVAQAKVNNWGTGAYVTLDAHPSTATGHWSTPMERDPFQVSIEEKADFLHTVLGAPEALGLTNVSVSSELIFRRQHKVFAATTGAYTTQTLVWTGPSAASITILDPTTWRRLNLAVPVVPLQSAGYECVTPLRIHDRLPRLVDEIRRQDNRVPLPVGKYTVVFDAHTTAALIRSTIGYAAELDRIRGDEINAAGTSYLKLDSLGTRIAHPTLTVTGTRSLSRGPAAIGWDDDGIAPQPFDIVNQGVLNHLVTGREHAPMLEAHLRQQHRSTASSGESIVSRGCVTADTAANLPLVRSPDLVMRPSKDEADFDTLMANAKEGVAVLYGDCVMDRSLGTGQGYGYLFEIRNGQLGRYFGTSAAFRFRASELLNSIIALGGASSAELRGFTPTKGEPAQSAPHGVVAVPMQARDIILFDSLSF